MLAHHSPAPYDMQSRHTVEGILFLRMIPKADSSVALYDAGGAEAAPPTKPTEVPCRERCWYLDELREPVYRPDVAFAPTPCSSDNARRFLAE